MRPEMANQGDVKMSGRPRVILIVEDEPLVRLDVAESLHQAGYNVFEAANSGEAMDLLRVTPVDLLFTDISLGKGMNGVELALWALANSPRLKALLTTGERMNAAIPPALGPVLAKPYRVDELLNRVEYALRDLAQSGSASVSHSYRRRGH
jgi:DNA-binding response OmpR family regulator